MERKNKRIKQLHKILKKRVQTKQTADKKRESINLKKWNENAKKIKLKNEIQQKWQERKDKIEAKEKIKNTLKKKYCFNLKNGLKQLKNEIEASENTKNKQKRSNAWSKIKKTIFAAIIDLISIVIAIIFLKEVIFVAALILLAVVLIVCCGVAIKNGRDYKNLGKKISAFEEKQQRLNILPQQQIVPGRENSNLIQNDLINND